MLLMGLLALVGAGALAPSADARGCAGFCAQATSQLAGTALDASLFSAPRPLSGSSTGRYGERSGSGAKPALSPIGGGPTSFTVTQARQAEVGRPAAFIATASGGSVVGGGQPTSFSYQYEVFTSEEIAKSEPGFADGEKRDCPYGAACEVVLPANTFEGHPSPGSQYVIHFTALPDESSNNGLTESEPLTITIQPALSNAKIEALQNSNAPAGEVIAGSLQTLSASAELGVPPYTYTWNAAAGAGDRILEPASAESVTELFADEKEGYGAKVFNPENEKFGLKNTPVNETTSVTITDADGAEVHATNVTGKILATLMKASITSPAGTIYATAGTTFSASGTGGVSPYTYEWSDANATGKSLPLASSAFKTVGSGQSIDLTFPASETVQQYVVSVTVQDAAQPYAQAVEEGVEVTVQPTPKIEEKTSVSCAGGVKPQTITFKLPAITQATGCFTEGKSSSGATTYTSSGTIKVNDLPITPGAATGPIVLTGPSKANPGGTIAVPDAAVALGLPNGKALQIVQGKLQLSLPTLEEGQSSGQAKVASLESSKGVSLFGFKIAGGITLNFNLNGKGEYTSNVDLNLNLPSVFKSGPPDGSNPPGGVSGEVQVKIAGGGPVFEGLHFEVENVYIGDLTVNEVCLTLIPGGSGYKSACQPKNASFTAPSSQVIEGCGTTNVDPNVDTWTADASISLPKPLNATIGLFGGGETTSGGSTKIDYLGGEGSNLGIPLFEGVDLERLGAGICFNPLKITGEVGVGLMPVDGNDAVVLSGALTYIAGEPYTPATSTTAAIPAKPWNLNFKGEVEVFKQEVGNGEIDVDQDGDFNFGVNLKYAIGSYVTLTGGVSGWVQPQYKLFDVNGRIMVAINVAGVSGSAQAEGVVSSTGAAGCIGVSVFGETISAGAGALWNQAPNVMFGSCSIGAYEAAQAASVAAAGGAKALTLPAGLRGIALRIAGTTGSPRVLISGPGGRRIESPAKAPLALVKGKYLLMEDPTHKATDVLLVAPKPGRYTITSLTPGDSIASIGTGRVLPTFHGHGHVSGKGALRTLHLTYALPAGSKLGLVERGGHVVKTIAKDVHGTHCKQGGHPMLCFTTKFAPAQGAGGVRNIEAEVSRGGLPLPPVVVARYKAPSLRLPSKPGKAQLVRHGSTVTIRWSRASASSRYSVVATTSLGSQKRFALDGKCQAVKISDIPNGVGVHARIEGVRFDGIAGPAKTLSLKGGHQKAGTKGKQLSGKLCGA